MEQAVLDFITSNFQVLIFIAVIAFTLFRAFLNVRTNENEEEGAPSRPAPRMPDFAGGGPIVARSTKAERVTPSELNREERERSLVSEALEEIQELAPEPDLKQQNQNESSLTRPLINGSELKQAVVWAELLGPPRSRRARTGRSRISSSR